MPRKIGDRPEIAPAQIRKIINESIQVAASGTDATTTETGGAGLPTNGKGDVSNQIKSGNMHKGPNVT
jgi:hypothetical protein